MSVKDLLQAVQSGAMSPDEAKRALRAGAVSPTRATQPRRAEDTTATAWAEEPIAIIGISGRYPGAADLQRYWALLASGGDAVVEIPESRWRTAEYSDPSLPSEYRIYAKWLGVVDDIDSFDPLFFAISPGEAEYMDPQHRLFMEEAYRAFEDAGYAGESLSESNCGVYFGIMSREYGDLMLENPQLGGNTTGQSGAIGSARVSYYLNLKGPAIPIDTACSSSLVATHLACQALRSREIDMALTGGSTVYISPRSFAGMCAAGMLSPTGRCRAFDDDSDGFVPGEGVGTLVLKRLSDAEADGDAIHGLIVASGINQDGKTNGITAPCKSSQIGLTRTVYDRYGIDPDTIGYVEMHGTGTNLGDPIELSALATTFRERTARRNFCAIGSVKTNLGHTSAAAGVAGIHKILLCMRHGMLVPSLHFDKPNRHFDFDASPFFVNTTFRPWRAEADRPLRAAISSFGFSGTNAHLVIEQYRPRSKPASGRAGPFLCVLSAMDDAALVRNAAELSSFLRSRHDLDLDDVAYTLQVGRAQRERRLAMLAQDRDQLLAMLDGFLDGGEQAGVWHGGADGSRLVEALSDRDDLSQIQRGWLDTDPARLGALWVKGLDADWRAVRRDMPARRVGLPTYRFARERYWLDFAKDDFGRDASRSNASPLLAADAVARSFRIRLDGDEFYLSGHRVDGVRVLPAAQCLEIARAAAEACLGELEEGHCIELADVMWRQPIVADDRIGSASPLWIDVLFSARGDLQWDFALNVGQTVHCSGRARAAVAQADAASAPMADIGGDDLPAGDLYAVLEWMGISYEAANRGIATLRVDDHEARVWLQLPESAPKGDFGLHPTMLDSALQATLGLAMRQSAAASAMADEARASLPFALESIRVFGQTSARMQARIRHATSHGSLRKYDLDLFDSGDGGSEPGRLLVQLRGFSCMEKTQPAAAQPALNLLVPVWRRIDAAIAPSATPGNSSAALVVGATAEQFDAVAVAFPQAIACLPAGASATEGAQDAFVEAIGRAGAGIDRVFWFTSPIADPELDREAATSALNLFDLIKDLLERGYGTRPLTWTVVTVATQSVNGAGDVRPAHSTLPGLVGSMAKEYPHWTVRMLDIDDDRTLSVHDLEAAPAIPGGGVAAFREGHWWSQHLAPVDVVGELGVTASAYRHDGLYVIVGGAGGVGEAWSEWMIRRYRAQIVWLGRREEDDAIRTKLERLAVHGPRPFYVCADCTDADSLAQACGLIKVRFEGRPVNGIVHSAIVLDDRSLANMSRDAFSGTLRAKVDVSLRLARAFSEEPLDFVLFFSSMQSFIRAAGQSNYAAGCTFKDGFARHLDAQWPCAVKTVNWGYWGGTGVVATPEHRQRMASVGLGSIEADEGMAALELLLATPLRQLGVLKTTRPDVAASFCVPDERVTVFAGQPATHIDADPQDKPADVASGSDGFPSAHSAQAELDAIMATLLWVQLHRLCASCGVDSLASLKTHIESQFSGWLDESVRVLSAQGLLKPGQDPVLKPRGRTSLHSVWERHLAALRSQPATGLVEAMLTSLPDVLTGAAVATDIIFREPSMEQVEGVYRGTVVADHYNTVLADALLAHLQQHRRNGGRGLRILEIGAGTGGTSALLFERLRPHRDAIGEYLYTDLSRAFLLHAEANFRPSDPYIRCALFDVEKPLQAQGVDIGGYDVVVATNVLHATRDIRNAIRNAKAALAPGGVLLLNEISRKSLFAHLTFGLLKGWWLAEDTALRIPGSPALTPDTWNRTLHDEGFAPVRFPAAAAHENGQQVVVAYSDGVIRQRAAERVDDAASDAPALPAAAWSGDAPLRQRAAALVAEAIGAVLKLEPARIDPRTRLERYGLDSILAVQMAAHLGRTLGEVKSTLFIEYQTIDALAEHLLATRQDEMLRVFGLSAASLDAAANAASAALRPSPAAASLSALSPQDDDARQAIAIVAVSGRFPMADSVEALWERLVNGESCLQEVPASRWNHALYFDADRSRLGKTYCRWGGFIEGVDEFDALFFDFSPAAAGCTDPQIRLFLQTTWDLLERGGYTREAIERKYDSQVGVFVGAMYLQYQTLDMDYVMHAGLSLSSYAAISNRVSNFFDFKGPSVAVDTQCSSGMIALHMARQSLLSGECAMAVAGAVNLILSPKKYIGLSIPMMLGSHDRCRSFGDGGDGFMPSEGVGAVLLKPLIRAIEDNDPVLAVIRNTAQSHGGRGIGYGTQDPNAKYALIGRCIDQSGLDARSIGYVEAAATGNAMSDAMEVSALTRAFSERSADKGFCALGTVKSNLGHSESASGIAQLAKVILQMQHRLIPPLIRFDTLNRDMDFAASPFRLSFEPTSWERPVLADAEGRPVQLPRRALIDCFGGGGSLACALIEEYAPDLPAAVSFRGTSASTPAEHPSGPQLIVLSARTAERLDAVVARLRDALKDAPTLSLGDVAYTLQIGREAMECRLAMLVDDRPELLRALDALQRNTVADRPADDDGAARRWTGDLGAADRDTPLNWGAEAEAAVRAAIDARDLPTLAKLWCRGCRVEWRMLHPVPGRRIVRLPGYPFEKKRCWLPEGGSPDYEESMSMLEAAYRPDAADALALPDAVHREIGAVLGLQASELSHDTLLGRFELPHVLIPRLRHHLQQRLGLELEPARLAGCRTVGEVLALAVAATSGEADAATLAKAAVAGRKRARAPKTVAAPGSPAKQGQDQTQDVDESVESLKAPDIGKRAGGATKTAKPASAKTTAPRASAPKPATAGKRAGGVTKTAKPASAKTTAPRASTPKPATAGKRAGGETKTAKPASAKTTAPRASTPKPATAGKRAGGVTKTAKPASAKTTAPRASPAKPGKAGKARPKARSA